MDLGEVVSFNHSDFAFTIPSPPVDYAFRLNCGRIHPSLPRRGNIRFSYSYILFSKLFSIGLNYNNLFLTVNALAGFSTKI